MKDKNLYTGKIDMHDYKKLAIDFIQKWMPDFYTKCRCGELNSRAMEKCLRCGSRL